MKIDKELVISFRKDFASCVADLEKKYGVTMRIGSIRYTEAEFHGKLTVRTNDPELQKLANSSLNNSLKFLCQSHSVKTSPTGLIGSVYTYEGKKYTISDFVSRRRKYPITANCSDGRSYRLPWAYLRMMKLEA
jgi:hypothetical protein